jgi:hypothetical protein
MSLIVLSKVSDFSGLRPLQVAPRLLFLSSREFEENAVAKKSWKVVLVTLALLGSVQAFGADSAPPKPKVDCSGSKVARCVDAMNKAAANQETLREQAEIAQAKASEAQYKQNLSNVISDPQSAASGCAASGACLQAVLTLESGAGF